MCRNEMTRVICMIHHSEHGGQRLAIIRTMYASHRRDAHDIALPSTRSQLRLLSFYHTTSMRITMRHFNLIVCEMLSSLNLKQGSLGLSCSG